MASKTSHHDQHLKKRKDLHQISNLFNTFKKDNEASSQLINKSKIRESIFNAKKLQRQSKLI